MRRIPVVQKRYAEDLLRTVGEYKIDRSCYYKAPSLTSIAEAHDISGLPRQSRR